MCWQGKRLIAISAQRRTLPAVEGKARVGMGAILHESGGKHGDQICARHNLRNKKEVWDGKHDPPLASLAFEYGVCNTSESAAFR